MYTPKPKQLLKTFGEKGIALESLAIGANADSIVANDGPDFASDGDSADGRRELSLQA